MKRLGFVLGVASMLAALLVFGPPPAFAQRASVVTQTGQIAVLYELTESMKLTRDGQLPHRDATSALGGYVYAGSLCPEWLTQFLGIPACGLNSVATDDVNLATGQGPVHGKFQVVIQGDNPVDGPELVIARGSFSGRVDLAPAVLGPDGIPGSGDEIPLGTINAEWSVSGVTGGPLEGLTDGGKFSGVFRLPFMQPPYITVPSYLTDPAGPTFTPVQATELALGVPTVRLEINFISEPRYRFHER